MVLNRSVIRKADVIDCNPIFADFACGDLDTYVGQSAVSEKLDLRQKAEAEGKPRFLTVLVRAW